MKVGVFDVTYAHRVGTTEDKSNKWPKWDSKPRPPDCESDALTTRPLLTNYFIVTLKSRLIFPWPYVLET